MKLRWHIKKFPDQIFRCITKCCKIGENVEEKSMMHGKKRGFKKSISCLNYLKLKVGVKKLPSWFFSHKVWLKLHKQKWNVFVFYIKIEDCTRLYWYQPSSWISSSIFQVFIDIEIKNSSSFLNFLVPQFSSVLKKKIEAWKWVIALHYAPDNSFGFHSIINYLDLV